MERETCRVYVEVIAEAVYVLAKTYKLGRMIVQQSLTGFLQNENIETPNRAVVETALRCFGETQLDFVDCLMVGYAIVEGHHILTFDKELMRRLP